MGDQAHAALDVIGWPAALVKRELRSAHGTDRVWEEQSLDYAPCEDDSGFGGTEAWRKLAQALSTFEAEQGFEMVTFEAFEEEPPEGFRPGEYGRLTLEGDYNGGSYRLLDGSEIPAALREVGLAYVVTGDPYWSEWDGDFEAWRPGWAKPESGPAHGGDPLLERSRFHSIVIENEGEAAIIRVIEAYYGSVAAAYAWRPWEPALAQGCTGYFREEDGLLAHDSHESCPVHERAEVAGDPRGEADR